jgi:transglutaminase-like putative cysteine protease
MRFQRASARALRAPASLLSAVTALLAVAGVARADAFDPWTDSARYAFSYRVALDAIPAEPGDRIRVWIPLPAETPDQRVLALDVTSTRAVQQGVDAQGNRMASVSWEGTAAAGEILELTTRVERRPAHGIAAADVDTDSPDDPRRHLAAARRIPLDGMIEQIAVQESRGLEGDAAMIRAFYDYVVTTMRYSKEGEGWGQGDAIWACTSKYGNCTDFHSLFLGMARSQGIPARFWIGFPVPPDRSEAEIAGYHCWAEAWDRARGWVPFDASEAWKAKRFDDYFGTLPSDRIVFTMGRDLVLDPPQLGPPLNYFVYPYAERNGEPVEGVKGAYAFERLEAPTESARAVAAGAR